MSISAVINTKNAAETLERTLQSLAFVDEIIVADMQSTDKTREIARSFTQHIISVSDAEYVEPARNTAIAAASSEWILLIDADEVVTTELAEKLLELSRAPGDTSAYLLARKNIIFSHWIQHTGWWPDYVLRFFKKGSVQWKDKIHSAPKVTGNTQNLPATEALAIVHYNYHSIEQFIEKLNRYTTIEAATRPQSPDSPVVTFRKEILRRLFAEDGFADGKHGIALSFLQSFYELSVSLKQWQQADFPNSLSRTEALQELTELKNELAYWIATERIATSTGFKKLYWKLRRRFLV